MTNDLPPSCARKYRFERMIGAGSHGSVALATQIDLDRPVAVKVLHEEFVDQESLVARFVSEARLTAALVHPSIVVLIDHGIDDGVPWIVYEYLPGKNLREIVDRGPMATRDALFAGEQIAAALAFAHEKGIIHRDIKPANVIVVSPGSYKVADFGLARTLFGSLALTKTGCVVGTPAYMAPELFEGDPPSVLTDIYATGATLYHLLTGTAPRVSTILDHARHPDSEPLSPPSEIRPEVPQSVDRVVMKAMALDAAQRFKTAAALVDALHRAQSALDAPTVPLGRPRSFSSVSSGSLPGPAAAGPGRRGMVAVAVGALLVGGLLASRWAGQSPAVAPTPSVAASGAASPSPTPSDEPSGEREPLVMPPAVVQAIASVRDHWRMTGELFANLNPFSGKFDTSRALRVSEEFLPAQRKDLEVLSAWIGRNLGRIPNLETASQEELFALTRARAYRFMCWADLDRVHKTILLLTYRSGEAASEPFTPERALTAIDRITYGSEGVSMLRWYLQSLAAYYAAVVRNPREADSALVTTIIDSRSSAQARGHARFAPRDEQEVVAAIDRFRRSLVSLPGQTGHFVGQVALRFWDWGDLTSRRRIHRVSLQEGIAELESLRREVPGAARAIDDLRRTLEGELRTCLKSSR